MAALEALVLGYSDVLLLVGGAAVAGSLLGLALTFDGKYGDSGLSLLGRLTNPGLAETVGAVSVIALLAGGGLLVVRRKLLAWVGDSNSRTD